MRKTRVSHRAVPQLSELPRPVYARAESIRRRTATLRHSHPWVQLSYASRGVLQIHTAAGRFMAPPQRAILVPPQAQHQVVSTPHTEMRSLYIRPEQIPWAPAQCRVIEVSPLLRELIQQFSTFPVEYDEEGAQGRLVQVLLDQLAAAPAADISLPWPQDERLADLCQQIFDAPEAPVTLREWSGAAGVSERTLSRLFLRETQLSFRLWRQRARLLRALPLLEEGRAVTDVALDSGYESTSAFIAAFRQFFGYTPGALTRTGEQPGPRPGRAAPAAS